MNIIGAFNKAFHRKNEKGWDKIYVLLDVHDTIIKGVYKKDEPWLWYEFAIDALKLMSDRNDICLILWTGSSKKRCNEIVFVLEEKGVHINYVNENPESEDSEFYCSFSKIYFNVGIDDKFGFDPYEDWEKILFYFKNILI